MQMVTLKFFLMIMTLCYDLVVNVFKMTDGYSVCWTCYEKLADRPICENCFCASCYSSVD